MKDMKMQAVECECGKPHVMSVATDLEKYKDDTWRFRLKTSSPEGVNSCCVELIKMGIDNVVHAVQAFHNATGQRVELLIEVPTEVVEE